MFRKLIEIRERKVLFCKSVTILLVCVLMCGMVSCRSSKGAVGKKHHQAPTESLHVGKAGKIQKKIIEEAYTWMGTPYAYACSEKGEGADCSGMVLRVYEDVAAIKLPCNSAKQAEFCKELKPEDVEPGDLVFFATGKDASKISHVGIVIDDRNFIHASSSKGVVISDLTTPYYIRTFKMFGRPPGLK